MFIKKKVKKGKQQLVHKTVRNEETTEKWNANCNQLLKFFSCPELPWILVACLSLLKLPQIGMMITMMPMMRMISTTQTKNDNSERI